MTLLNLLTHQLIVTRLSPISGNKTAFVTATISIFVDIQRVDDTKAVEFGGAIGKTYKIYAESETDIQDGDRLKDLDDGAVYQVMAGGINDMTLGNLDHMEILVKKVND